MNTDQDGDRLMRQVQPQRNSFSSSLDFFSTMKFSGISAAAELAVMKRAGDNHLYALYVLLRIECRNDEIIKIITS